MVINMKQNAFIAITFLLASFALSACAPVTPIGQTSEDSNLAENGASTEISGNSNTSTHDFFNDIGKTLGELRQHRTRRQGKLG